MTLDRLIGSSKLSKVIDSSFKKKNGSKDKCISDKIQ